MTLRPTFGICHKNNLYRLIPTRLRLFNLLGEVNQGSGQQRRLGAPLKSQLSTTDAVCFLHVRFIYSEIPLQHYSTMMH